MIILGWHGGIKWEYEDMAPGWSTHDGAAVLLKDGEVIAAIEEERLNRVKHSNYFPLESIRACLRLAGIDFASVDCVAMNFTERTRDIFPSDLGLPSVNLFLEDSSRHSFTVRDCICNIFRKEFEVDIASRLFFCHHHIAHLWSAWAMSPFASSLVFSLDGQGDALSGMVALGYDGRLSILRQYSVEQSLGNLYSDMIRFLGYQRFDEYKAMGLAPYGNPERYNTLFGQLYRLLPQGQYELINQSERWAYLYDAGILPHARRAGELFSSIHKDFAASLQQMLENIAMHVLEHFRLETQQQNLCLAGGVAHNAAMNGKILYAGGFKSVFVQPAAHDAGGALGAAIAAYQQDANEITTRKLTHVFWGRGIGSSEEIGNILGTWQEFLTFQAVNNVTRDVARLLADGVVIGWVQGRSEFGPRALGHRSILADPRPAENTVRINSMVKKREAFRPFAPSICEEQMAEILELPVAMADYSYMTFVLQVRDSARAKLAAVTHIDGTARIQSVSRLAEPQYWELIREFERLTGVPAILNTSFNNNAEPIVDSVEDAIVCFLTTDIDALVIGDYLIYKRELKHLVSSYASLRPSLRRSHKLVKRIKSRAVVATYHIEATASRHFVETQIELSKDMFLLLLVSDGQQTLADLYVQIGVSAGSKQHILTEEIMNLWHRRAIVLRP